MERSISVWNAFNSKVNLTDNQYLLLEHVLARNNDKYLLSVNNSSHVDFNCLVHSSAFFFLFRQGLEPKLFYLNICSITKFMYKYNR